MPEHLQLLYFVRSCFKFSANTFFAETVANWANLRNKSYDHIRFYSYYIISLNPNFERLVLISSMLLSFVIEVSFIFQKTNNCYF
jgi:hypothetical protein